MSEYARSYVTYLTALADTNRGALAHLRRSLSFAPGSYPPAFPYVEPFVAADVHAEAAARRALYLTAGLYALHPDHMPGSEFALRFGRLGNIRESTSIEQRFVALLGADPAAVPTMLRQAVTLLCSDRIGFDYAVLLVDLTQWLNEFDHEGHDRLRRRWARQFYRTFESKTTRA